ncbi:MAG: hypothetical protein LBD11_02720 [Candidatus Peribacteria bacterium]|jgi:hypothetical protein|nr:hypothetical protein [Candidatus Peribacteria bacterium]
MYKTKISLTAFTFFLGISAFSLAEYEIKLDTEDKKVYIVSDDTQISLENVADYFSGTLADTGSTTGSGTNQPANPAPAFSGSVLKELGS